MVGSTTELNRMDTDLGSGWRPAEWWGLSMQSSAAISQRA